MTTQAFHSLRRTGREIAGMMTLAGLALACVAAVNHSVESRLEQAEATVTQASFAEVTEVPIPVEPSLPAIVMITAPAEGVFQAGNTAGGPALVAIGSKVTPETKVGTIQPMNATAMPLLAGVTGTVKEILVKDQDMVVAGQALIKIEPFQMPAVPQ